MAISINALKNKYFSVDENDALGKKMAMLFEGQCTIGVKAACEKYNYTEVRYYQLLKLFNEHGAIALVDKKRGSDKQPVRTKEVTNQIIRYRFMDPLSSTDVIAQKLKQAGYNVSKRSVERTITEFGLQKKHIH